MKKMEIRRRKRKSRGKMEKEIKIIEKKKRKQIKIIEKKKKIDKNN